MGVDEVIAVAANISSASALDSVVYVPQGFPCTSLRASVAIPAVGLTNLQFPEAGKYYMCHFHDSASKAYPASTVTVVTVSQASPTSCILPDAVVITVLGSGFIVGDTAFFVPQGSAAAACTNPSYGENQLIGLSAALSVQVVSPTEAKLSFTPKLPAQGLDLCYHHSGLSAPNVYSVNFSVWQVGRYSSDVFLSHV